MAKAKSRLSDLVTKNEGDLLSEWSKELRASGVQRDDLMNESELLEQTREFLSQLRSAAHSGNDDVAGGSEWSGLRDLLSNITRTRVTQGFTPSQVTTFVLSFKRPLFDRLRKEYGTDPAFADEVWTATQLLDKIGLLVGEMYQTSREQIIARQQQEMLELSTPVVKLWDGILALPMIGTLDSARTQIVMESLLQKIVDTGAEIAIIDITGVPTVDTLVAQHLLKTVTAARLMGADCIISGIRPQIAQTIVHLGVDLTNVITKASLADAFALALQRSNLAVRRVGEKTVRGKLGGNAASQRGISPMERIPILQMGRLLLVTIQIDMHDRLAMVLQDDLTAKITQTGAKGVLIDISAVQIVDSFIGRMISNIASMSRILDAHTVVVGMQPAVAITLVELGMDLPGVRTALNVERGMHLLSALVNEADPAEGEDDDAADEE